MSESPNRKNYDGVVYLMSCALNNIAPSENYLSELSLDDVLRLASRHSVGALVTSALERIGKASAKAIEAKNMAIRKILLLDTERAEILAELEREKIRYMPLKGVYLKELYPSIGLRQMSDNDILYDGATREKIKDIMTARGYTVKAFKRSNHDVYLKEPVYNYEMHVSLFDEHASKINHDYFADALERGIPVVGTSYGYRMTDEDFYIYLKAHEYKHYSHGGTGLRSLADTYVFLKAHEKTLDMEYVNENLKKLGMLEYERSTKELANIILSEHLAKNPPSGIYELLDGEAFKMYEYMCFCGTYGTSANHIRNAIKEYEKVTGNPTKAKLKYLMRRLFPPMKIYEIYYPFYYKHKILIPFLTCKRFFRAIFKNPKKIWYQFKQIMKFDKKKTKVSKK